eukprot:3274977-Pyramimonas_sp.AAC.1
MLALQGLLHVMWECGMCSGDHLVLAAPSWLRVILFCRGTYARRQFSPRRCGPVDGATCGVSAARRSP